MVWENRQNGGGQFENKIQGTSEYESKTRSVSPIYRITEDGEERVLESNGLRLMEESFEGLSNKAISTSGSFENKLSGQSNWENKTI